MKNKQLSWVMAFILLITGVFSVSMVQAGEVLVEEQARRGRDRRVNCVDRYLENDGAYDDYDTVISGDDMVWRYVPAGASEIDLIIDFTCDQRGTTYLLAQYSTRWGCENVTNIPVKKVGSALEFNGNSGLDCTGETVYEAIHTLFPESTIEEYVSVDDYYLEVHVDPFTAGTASCEEDNNPSLPIFSDGTMSYSLDRNGSKFEASLVMGSVSLGNNVSTFGYTANSDPFTAPALVRTTFSIKKVNHTILKNGNWENIGTNNIGENVSYLSTDPEVVHIGHDGNDNFYCGFIVDFEIDPSFDPLGG